MSITIKHNKKPNLPICQMVCDKKIHPKFDKYELTKFLNCHSTNLLIGKPGSGKTNLIYQIMKSITNKCYDKIYLFQPEKSRASMKDKLFDQLPDDQKFEELTFENLEYVDETLDEEGNNYYIDTYNRVKVRGGTRVIDKTYLTEQLLKAFNEEKLINI